MELVIFITLVAENLAGLDDMCSHTICMHIHVIMLALNTSASFDKLRSDSKLIEIVLLAHGVLFEYLKKSSQS